MYYLSHVSTAYFFKNFQNAKLMTECEKEENNLRKRQDEMEAYTNRLEDEFSQLENALKEYKPTIQLLTDKAETLANQLVDGDTAQQLLVLQEHLQQQKLEFLENDNSIRTDTHNCKESLQLLKKNNVVIDSILTDLQEIDKAIG